MNRAKVIVSILLFVQLNVRTGTGLAATSPELGTAFTYNGQLTDSGSPVNGIYDFRFILYDANIDGSLVGNVLTNAPVTVANGLFMTALDFGVGVFNGAAYWLEIGVRTNGSAADFITLIPRQALTPTPYALYAPKAGTATNATSFTGTISDGQLSPNVARLTGSQTFTGTNIFSGRVGIGKADPATALDVVGIVRAGAFHANTLRWGPSQLSLDQCGAIELGDSLCSGAGPYIDFHYGSGTDQDFNVRLINESDGQLTLDGNLGVLGSIDYNGQLKKLDVADNFTATVGAADFRLGHSSRRGTAGRALVDLTDSLYLNCDSDWPNTRLGGTVGIDPGNQNNGSLTNGLRFGFDSGEGMASKRTPGANQGGLDFYTAFANRMSILNDGRVGIGKTDPATALDVNGIVTATSFAGSGAGLTSVPDAALPAKVARLDAEQTFSGRITFNPSAMALSILGCTPPFAVGSDCLVPSLNSDLLDGLSSADFWKLAGNSGTTPGVHFLGTTDNQALELKVNNTRALRLEPKINPPVVGEVSVSSVNVIGGASVNSVTVDTVGATIGGGGGTEVDEFGIVFDFGNRVEPDFGTIGGGYGNRIRTNSTYSTIGGGRQNFILADSSSSTISGGSGNTIRTNADYATIGGGTGNDINLRSPFSIIAGGSGNKIRPDSSHATIGGGDNNLILTNADYAAIGGGRLNSIGTDAADSTIGGGRQNTINPSAAYSTISGGWLNSIEAIASLSAIGGGYFNIIYGNADYSTIAGGRINVIETNAIYSSIGGGANNTIRAGSFSSAIGGGFENTVASNSYNATIGGGRDNVIESTGLEIFGAEGCTTIGGGCGNNIKLGAVGCTIAGGHQNSSGGIYSFIGGGEQHQIQSNGLYSAIVGGGANRIEGGAGYSFIGGGQANQIREYSPYCVIGGGFYNEITNEARVATIPGGYAARASNFGQLAYASGSFDFPTPGNAQMSFYVLRQVTTDATQTEMFLDQTEQRMKIPRNSTWCFDILVVARRAANFISAGYQIRGLVDNNNNSTVLEGVPTVTTMGNDGVAWTVSVQADNVNDALVIKVTGEASATIRWVANVRTVEVIY